jgi:hypothetical protein
MTPTANSAAEERDVGHPCKLIDSTTLRNGSVTVRRSELALAHPNDGCRSADLDLFMKPQPTAVGR